MVQQRHDQGDEDKGTLAGIDTGEFFYSMTFDGQQRMLNLLVRLETLSKPEAFVALCDIHLEAAALSVNLDGVMPAQVKEMVSLIVDQLSLVFGHTSMPNFKIASESAKRVLYARVSTGSPVIPSRDIHDIYNPLKPAHLRTVFDPGHMPGLIHSGGDMPKASPNGGKAQVIMPGSPPSNRKGPSHLRALAERDPRTTGQKAYSIVYFKMVSEMIDSLVTSGKVTKGSDIVKAMDLFIHQLASSHTPQEFAKDMQQSGYPEDQGHCVVTTYAYGYMSVKISKRYDTPNKLEQALIGVHEATIYPPPKHKASERLAELLKAQFVIQDELRQIKRQGGPQKVDPAEISNLFSTADETANLESVKMQTPENNQSGVSAAAQQAMGGAAPQEPILLQPEDVIDNATAPVNEAAEATLKAAAEGTDGVTAAKVVDTKTVTKTVKTEGFEFNTATIVSGLFSLGIFCAAVFGAWMAMDAYVLPWLAGLGIGTVAVGLIAGAIGIAVVGLVGYGCYKIYHWVKDTFFGEDTTTKVVAKVEAKTEAKTEVVAA